MKNFLLKVKLIIEINKSIQKFKSVNYKLDILLNSNIKISKIYYNHDNSRKRKFEFYYSYRNNYEQNMCYSKFDFLKFLFKLKLQDLQYIHNVITSEKDLSDLRIELRKLL